MSDYNAVQISFSKRCGHDEIVETCLFCTDANRILREVADHARKLIEERSNPHFNFHVRFGMDTDISAIEFLYNLLNNDLSDGDIPTDEEFQHAFKIMRDRGLSTKDIGGFS